MKFSIHKSGDNYDGPKIGLSDRMKGMKTKDDSLEIIDYGESEDVCPGDVSSDEDEEQPRRKQVSKVTTCARSRLCSTLLGLMHTRYFCTQYCEK